MPKCCLVYLNHASISKEVFDANKDQFWRSLFDIDSYETENRKFAYEISTNGYAVTIRIEKPKKPIAEVPYVPKEEDFERKGAGDPGVTNLCTVKIDGVPNGEYIRITTKEYRHMAQMRKHLKWNENLKKKNTEYFELIKHMPSCAVSSKETYAQNVKHILSHCDSLLAFGCVKGFRKWRFKMYVYSDKALHTLCKRITNGEKMIFGLGDWSQQDGIIKRHPTAPVTKFAKKMRTHAYVQMLDEWGTSKGCSCCGSVCKKQRLLRERKEGFEFVACHQVVRCSSNECAMCWQRDDNSSINHLKLLMCMLRGEERPAYMRRNQT